MKLNNRSTSTITTDTFEIEHEGKKYIYIEYLNDKNKVIDFNLRDADGNEIDDPALLEEIQEFVDGIGENK